MIFIKAGFSTHHSIHKSDRFFIKFIFKKLLIQTQYLCTCIWQWISNKINPPKITCKRQKHFMHTLVNESSNWPEMEIQSCRKIICIIPHSWSSIACYHYLSPVFTSFHWPNVNVQSKKEKKIEFHTILWQINNPVQSPCNALDPIWCWKSHWTLTLLATVNHDPRSQCQTCGILEGKEKISLTDLVCD